MSEVHSFHTFTRPDVETDAHPVGSVYSELHNKYDEGARYAYRQGAHDLVLFWKDPTPAEVAGVRDQPIEVGLYSNGPVGFLLYKIKDVCEWSDVAFNVHLVDAAERELPTEPTGERGRLRVTLVDADTGIIKAKRLVSLEKISTQALRHSMQEQAERPFVRTLYDIAIQETYARFADTDAMAEAAEITEPTHG